MILPIYGFGKQSLRTKTKEIDKDYPNLKELIANMFETMEKAYGVGLAAPQVGLPISLFIVDTSSFNEEYPDQNNFKKVLINPKIEEFFGEDWSFNEGCLSVPDIREDITRKSKIRITYLDEEFNEHTEEYDGIISRVIQHEYDHLEGKLFIDKVSSLKKMLLKKRLASISKGMVSVNYKMNFSNSNKK